MFKKKKKKNWQYILYVVRKIKQFEYLNVNSNIIIISKTIIIIFLILYGALVVARAGDEVVVGEAGSLHE